MPQCSYCGDSFSDEEALLHHLDTDHREELGRIDRRRVESLGSEDDANRKVVAIGAVALLLIGLGAVLLVIGGDDSPEPTPNPSVHEHGTMSIVIDGDELPLSESPDFVENDQIFHFHGYEMDEYGAHVWHIHGTDVTLQWALSTLGIEVNDAGTTLTYDGETYDDADASTSVDIRVNDESIEPGSYFLEGVGPESAAAAGDGDDVVIIVERDE